MNRREFLYAGTSAAGGMSARSYACVLGANDRVGLGVIGLGRRGTARYWAADRVARPTEPAGTQSSSNVPCFSSTTPGEPLVRKCHTRYGLPRIQSMSRL